MQRNQLRKKMQRNQWMLGSKRGRLNQKVGGQGDFGGADKLLHRLHPYVHLLLQREEGGMGKGRVQEIITTATTNLIIIIITSTLRRFMWFRLIVSVQHHHGPLGRGRGRGSLSVGIARGSRGRGRGFFIRCFGRRAAR